MIIYLNRSGTLSGEAEGGGGGRIFPVHPSPILDAPRDNISREGNPSLRPDAEYGMPNAEGVLGKVS